MPQIQKNKGTFFSSTFKVEGKKVHLFFGFVASGLKYCHYLIVLVWLQVDTIIKMTTWLYLSQQAPNPKIKGTLFPSTLKVEEKKVYLFFEFVASGLRYSHILIFLVWLQVDTIIKMTTWLYLSPEATNPKNKGTFFSPTFKVEGKKVPLFFGFVASGLNYSHVIILNQNSYIQPFIKM